MKLRPKKYALLPKISYFFVGPRRGTNAKTHRPMDNKKPLHICLRSRFAKGSRSLRGTNRIKVDGHVRRLAQRFGIKILKYANVGNHLHLVVKLPGSTATARRQYTTWIRLLTSRIAFDIGGSKKGTPLLDENGNRAKFWDALPFSRVIHGRQGWRTIDRYVLKNELEAQGFKSEIAANIAHEIYDSNRILRAPV